MINTSINIPIEIITTPNSALNPSCFEWCSMEHVTHSSNMELNAIGLLLAVYICIYLHNWFEHSERLKKYQYGLIYIARIFLILFFIWYILHVRLRVI